VRMQDSFEITFGKSPCHRHIDGIIRKQIQRGSGKCRVSYIKSNREKDKNKKIVNFGQTKNMLKLITHEV